MRKTTPGDRRLAERIIEALTSEESMDLRIGRKSIKLSPEVRQLVTQIFLIMKDGKSIAVLSSEMEITTQQAAELLNFSRPYVVRLLEEGKIPFRKVGTHRRLLLEDVLKYKQYLRKNKRDVLRFLAQEAQDMKLGYHGTT